MPISEKFEGEWILLPELSIYQNGEPPLSGKYIIRTNKGVVEFEIEWTDSTGKAHKLAFGGPLDGEKHEVKTPGLSSVVYKKINDFTLDSYAYSGDKMLLNARRVVAEDLSLLAVSQISYGDEGALTNLQVYRRK